MKNTWGKLEKKRVYKILVIDGQGGQIIMLKPYPESYFFYCSFR